MRRLGRLLLPLLLVLAAGAGATPARPATPEGELNVYAAASLTDALKELATAYEAEAGQHLSFNFAGSNVLALQIQAGAPADVFFSADEARMDALAGKRLVDATSRVSLLSNTLVIIVNAQHPVPLAAPADLAAPAVRRIALADPQSVPAGLYAKAWLKGQGLWTKVIDRVIPTENVRAALAAVGSGNVDAGIVYRTDAGLSDRVRVALEVPRAEGPAISYPVAALARSPRLEAARRFVAWLKTEPALAVFRKYGFLIAAGSG